MIDTQEAVAEVLILHAYDAAHQECVCGEPGTDTVDAHAYHQAGYVMRELDSIGQVGEEPAVGYGLAFECACGCSL